MYNPCFIELTTKGGSDLQSKQNSFFCYSTSLGTKPNIMFVFSSSCFVNVLTLYSYTSNFQMKTDYICLTGVNFDAKC